ncbi:MAG: altronate dehydratase [Clostridia bacterium]|nr:altronate dehydratase [Clostridia bacterium]
MEKKHIVHKNDNVYIDLDNGHKYALRDIKNGENIIKYGFPIGHATEDIAEGEHVHSHNVKTNLSDISEYSYKFIGTLVEKVPTSRTIKAYVRKNGDIGIRNEIFIVNTVGCINKTAQIIAEKCGVNYFSHPFGCSQLGGDMEITQKILAGLVKHPNAGGVLVLGLGCENNNIDEFKKVLGEVDGERVRFLNCQDCNDEIEEACSIIDELKSITSKDVRVDVPVSSLRIGLKCGGSDGYSGLTANPLVGSLCDKLVSHGGSCVLTEVPEMFGAEHLLMERCVSQDVFEKCVNMINNYKKYFMAHNQPIYENPSPGNKKGGITTLEEKSLGCVQKGGLSPVTDVITYGGEITKPGLTLMDGPGNDLVAVTNLACSGAHIVLFTTGRGTPFGGPVPTMKISTNSRLASKKTNWIDFDAGRLIDGESMSELTDELCESLLEIAEGKQTLNEKNGYKEISIFKDGVIL